MNIFGLFDLDVNDKYSNTSEVYDAICDYIIQSADGFDVYP